MQAIEDYVASLGLDAYLVGGAVRDELLGRESKDADFLVAGLDLDELRTALSEHGRRLARFSPEGTALGGAAAGEPETEFDLFFQVSDHFNDGESDGVGNFTLRVLRADAIGPVVELYALD